MDALSRQSKPQSGSSRMVSCVENSMKLHRGLCTKKIEFKNKIGLIFTKNQRKNWMNTIWIEAVRIPAHQEKKVGKRMRGKHKIKYLKSRLPSLNKMMVDHFIVYVINLNYIIKNIKYIYSYSSVFLLDLYVERQIIKISLIIIYLFLIGKRSKFSFFNFMVILTYLSKTQ